MALSDDGMRWAGVRTSTKKVGDRELPEYASDGGPGSRIVLGERSGPGSEKMVQIRDVDIGQPPSCMLFLPGGDCMFAGTFTGEYVILMRVP